jgi:hypothetical protein
MECNEHRLNGVSVLEVQEEAVVINRVQDLLDIVSDYSIKKVIIAKHNINPALFDLETGYASELLQKLTGYKICLGIVGDFENVENKALRDFIYVSNQARRLVFKASVRDILKVFCK